MVWRRYEVTIDKVGKSKRVKSQKVFWLTQLINCDIEIAHNGDEPPKENMKF